MRSACLAALTLLTLSPRPALARSDKAQALADAAYAFPTHDGHEATQDTRRRCFVAHLRAARALFLEGDLEGARWHTDLGDKQIRAWAEEVQRTPRAPAAPNEAEMNRWLQAYVKHLEAGPSRRPLKLDRTPEYVRPPLQRVYASMKRILRGDPTASDLASAIPWYATSWVFQPRPQLPDPEHPRAAR